MPLSGAPVSCVRSGLSLFDGAACLFLAIPVLIFCAWFKPVFALGLAALLIYGTWQALGGTHWKHLELSRNTLAMLAALALVWVALGGTGHWFYANRDWIFRDAVLRDLTAGGWPAAYPTTEIASLILRAPIGYYLPASLAGAAWGIKAAHIGLYLWTSLGFFLVFAGTLQLFQTRLQRVVAGILLLGFGGMDFVGYALLNGTIPQLGEHIEWWAIFAQYSSNSTLLFWVPNHALPAWLATILILRHWRQPALAGIAPLLGSCIPLWSPLAALGVLPFFLAGINWRRDLPLLLSPGRMLPAAVLALLCARYLTMGSESIPGGWIFVNNLGISSLPNLYLLLCFLEFGILCLILARLKALSPRTGIAIAILCLLPLYRFGYGNDIVMRASIPALFILMLACVHPLAGYGPKDWRTALAVVLGVGMLGSAQEPIRALLTPPWPPSDMSLVQASTRYSGIPIPVTYVTLLVQPDMRFLLRAPAAVLADTPDNQITQGRARQSGD